MRGLRVVRDRVRHHVEATVPERGQERRVVVAEPVAQRDLVRVPVEDDVVHVPRVRGRGELHVRADLAAARVRPRRRHDRHEVQRHQDTGDQVQTGGDADEQSSPPDRAEDQDDGEHQVPGEQPARRRVEVVGFAEVVHVAEREEQQHQARREEPGSMRISEDDHRPREHERGDGQRERERHEHLPGPDVVGRVAGDEGDDREDREQEGVQDRPRAVADGLGGRLRRLGRRGGDLAHLDLSRYSARPDSGSGSRASTSKTSPAAASNPSAV